MAGIRIGCQMITWMMDPNWQGGLPDILDQVAITQYAGVEVGFDVVSEYEHATEELEEMLTSHELSLAAVFYSAPLSDPGRTALEIQEATRAAEFLKRMGGSILVVAGGLPRPGVAFMQDFRTMAETLNAMGARCQRIGITLAYHPYYGSLVADRGRLGQFMEMTDPDTVFLAPDTGHLVRGRCGYKEVLTTFFPRIKHLHLKDITANGTWTHLGSGLCDFGWILHHLENNGYTGWAIVDEESILGTRTPLEVMGLNRNYLRTLGY